MNDKERVPFNPNLSFTSHEWTEGLNADLLHNLGDSYIVREFPIFLDVNPEKEALIQAREKRLADEKIADSMFNQLEEKYGVKVAKHRRVVGPSADSTKESIYTIVEKIDGKTINTLSTDELLKYQEKIDRTLAGIISYLSGIIVNGGIFLSDLATDQFMAGKPVKRPNEDSDVYLVDVDPIYLEYSLDPENENNKLSYFISHSILRFVGDIYLMQQKANINLEKTTESLAESIKLLKNIKNPDIDWEINEMAKYSNFVKNVITSTE